MDKQYVTVSALNQYLKRKVDTDRQLANLYIKGEVSNFKRNLSSGHLYFTLKDESSRISAIMYKSKAEQLGFDMKDGDQVLIHATVSVYAMTGTNQLICQSIEPDGIGQLYLKFEALKKKLQEEGLFDEIHKKPIPAYPMKIAILSAYPSAALSDILRTIKMRFPIAQVIVFPIPVQGKDAYLKIIHTLKNVDRLKFHVICIARGGGSLEDLWNFNEEALARTIFQCQTPIVSGVGHEIDFTICDFVSDYRGATPTAAAVRICPDMKDLISGVQYYRQRLTELMTSRLSAAKKDLQQVQDYYLFKNPEKLYSDYYQNIAYLQDKLTIQFKSRIDHARFHYSSMHHQLMNQSVQFVSSNQFLLASYKEALIRHIQGKLDAKKQQLSLSLVQLDALSPLKTIQRGYAIVEHEGKTITSVAQIENQEEIDIRLKDGIIHGKVCGKEVF